MRRRPCVLPFAFNETEGVKEKMAIFRFVENNETGEGALEMSSFYFWGETAYTCVCNSDLTGGRIIKGQTFQSENEIFKKCCKV